ncbi:BTAD domain-containing putative transcriptional regulator [Actinocrispum sp. NPDC049592]|uniref:AfsR/SARP family transcriptional regulator n=1 Tax=Actinocrispum sp. NPDC049592 TaxID=3154835 RepID=UPI003439E578
MLVLHLFGGPYITVAGERQEIPAGSQRLLVLTALHRGRVDRHFAAGLLWPIGNDQRAGGNLRSAIWRLRGVGVDVIRTDNVSIFLRDEVEVDAQFASEWARRMIDGTCVGPDVSLFPWFDDALHLLPGWYDDWAIIAREQLRQRVLHAIEGLSRRFCEAGRLAEGVEAAMTVVCAEPLRESAQRVLIEAHLAEGNVGEARRAFEEYRTCVRTELGVDPSPALTRLVSLSSPRALRAVAHR